MKFNEKDIVRCIARENIEVFDFTQGNVYNVLFVDREDYTYLISNDIVGCGHWLNESDVEACFVLEYGAGNTNIKTIKVF